MITKNISEISNTLELNLDNIFSSSLNPREYFDENKLFELAGNIDKVGVIQPIIVRLRTDNKYEVVCGERRYRASMLANKNTIPAIIRVLTDEEAQDLAFIENIQREDMRTIDEANAIQVLIDSNKEDFDSLADRLGKSVKYIRDRYQLAGLIDPIKTLMNDNDITIGKAVLLASYSSDIQENVFNNHLNINTDDYRYWGNLSYSSFLKKLNSNYNTNLDNAQFDKSDCLICPHNSSYSDLFAADGDCNSKCLNKECFVKKTKDTAIHIAIERIELNPSYLIVKSNNSTDWLITSLEERGFEICSVKFAVFPTEPITPSEPNSDDYLDEDTHQIIAEDWEECQSDYLEELQEYENNLQEYNNTVQLLNEKAEAQTIEMCYFIRNSKIEYGYIPLINTTEVDITTTDSPATVATTDNPSKADRAEILKLQAKDQRNHEIKIEKTIHDLKVEVLKSDVDLSETKGVKLEEDILFYFLLNDLSHENRKAFFNGEVYPEDKDKYEFVNSITPEQRITVIRDYIITKMKSYASTPNSIASNYLIEFCKHHFAELTESIESKHDAVYTKRNSRLNERIDEIKASMKNNEKVEEVATVESEVTSNK